MPNHNKPHKSQPGSVISPELAELRSKLEQVQKTVQEQSIEKNQWNVEVKGWVGKRVCIVLIHGPFVTGELRWVDRYTMCLVGQVPSVIHGTGDMRTMIVHKGAIALMYQEVEMKVAAVT